MQFIWAAAADGQPWALQLQEKHGLERIHILTPEKGEYRRSYNL